MAQRLTTSFINTVIPGAYPNVSVKSVPVGVASTGVIAIIGEAAGGADFSSEDIKNNFFTPDQADRVAAKYVSGPIVDAMRALAAPSADANIAGSATRIFIVKTNAGDKASAIVDTDFGSLSAKNFGIGGNQIKYKIVASQLEDTPETTSSVAIPAFGAALDGLSFSIRLNGGAVSVVTLSNTPANHSNIATLVTELAGLLPSGISASAGTAANTLKLKIDTDSANYRKGWGKSFELIDSTPGDLDLVKLAPGLFSSASESAVEINVVRQDAGLNETLEAKGEVALQVGYLGTTATLTIAGSTLSTVVTGGAGAALSVDLSSFSTVADLAAFIASKPGYSASASALAQQMKPADLDRVSAIGICSSGAGLKAGRVKKSLANVKAAIATSAAVDLEPTATAGLPSPISSFSFLSGGAKGSTSGADIVDALGKLEAVVVNFIVPLFSQDASDDIAEGLTDSASTYTIDAIHAAVKSHVLKMSVPSLKRYRLAVLSYFGSYANAKTKAQTLANYRCSMTFQKVSEVDSQGSVVEFQPWMGACLAAGMQAAGFYKGITNKFANLISFKDPSGFDSGSPGDVEDALLAGLLILQRETAGSKWVSDQTTYGFDTNFVYNSLQATYLADIVAADLADSLQRAFVGQSLADVDAATALAFIATKMEEYRRIKAITGDDEAPLGYRNAKVKISGPTMSVAIEIKLSTTIYFIPIELTISQVQSSASQ
jgi:hypothetical protein